VTTPPSVPDASKSVQIADPRIAEYALAHTTPHGPALAALRADTEARTPYPMLAGGVVEARLLEALVTATRATRVLDVGTFTGTSALAMASRLQPGGRLTTIEADPQVAELARRHVEASEHRERIELIVGDARETIDRLDGPFDLVFVDAWKHDYATYFEAVLPKLADHGLVVCDNVLWHGLVLQKRTEDAYVNAIKAFNDRIQQDERVDNALLTVGDGLLLIWKRAS